MAREYFNAYHSILEAMEPLNDAERGRLFTALLIYSSTGTAEKLTGNERFVFPGLRSQIDRDIKKYDDFRLKQSENGKKGGRPPKPTEIQETQPFSEEPKKANEKEKEKEKEKDKDIGSSEAGKPPTCHRFIPPSVEEVRAYCAEQGYSSIDPERFVNYYLANGWRVGKNPMKDWKAAVRGWNSREKQDISKAKSGPRQLDADETAAILRMLEGEG